MSIVFQWHKNVGNKSETNQKFQMDKSYQHPHNYLKCGSPQESPRRASPSDTPGFSQSDRLESLRSRGEFKDISTDAFNLICSAWRRGTEKSYSQHLMVSLQYMR